MDELSRRIRRVTESVLENESLTADLSDEAAQALLDWMIDCAKMVAQSTATLDEPAAEEAMSPRLRAIRRLMRLVNNWVAQGPPAEIVANQEQLDKILEQAAIIYGQDFTTFDSNRFSAFWEQEVDSVEEPRQLIESLRALIEDPNDQIIPDQEKPMAAKKSRSTSRRKTSRKGQTGSGRSLSTIIVVIVLLFALGYFLITGSDPLGLFRPIEVTPTVPADIGDGDGDWWQVYFTDPVNRDNPDDMSGTVAEKLIGNINNAQRSIHIASFEFNLTPVAEALIAAHQRGVEVLWVTDDEYGIEADEEEDHGQFAMLEEAGIAVKDDGRSALMHNKFWIFDDQKVWTGSTNVTVNGIFQNNNNVLVINSPRVAAMYEREFDEMWAGEFGPSSPSTVDSQQTTINGVPVQVLFAAEDEVIDKLIPLLQNAQHSIRFMAFAFTHDALGKALLDRAKAGVEVKGIFETRGSETEFSQLAPLYCAGVQVRQDGNPRTFHHKVFVIDDNILITGSLNFSDNANDSNDENTVIVTNAEIAAQYLQEFDRRWAEATEPQQANMNCR